MSCRRIQQFMILLLMLLHTSAASFAATVIYAQTMKGSIYKSTDSAHTWQPVPPPASATVGSGLAVDPQNTNNLYSLFSTGVGKMSATGFYRSVDGGQTWTGTTLPNQLGVPIVVDATASNILYANGGNHGIYRSTDSGVTFQAVSLVAAASINTPIIKSDASQPGVVYAVVDGSTKAIYKSADYGVTWALLTTSLNVFGNPSGTIEDFTTDPTRKGVMYVAAYASTFGKTTTPCGLLQSTDSGNTWQSVFADAFGNVVVDPRNGNIYSGGYFPGAAGMPIAGEVVKSLDGGKTFVKVTSGLTRLGTEVHLDPESANVLYASQSRTVGVDQGSSALQPAGVFVSTDSGTTWKLGSVDPALKPPNDQIYSLAVLSSNNPPAGVVNVSAAGGRTDLFAPDAIVSAFGTGLAAGTEGASTNPPSTTLAGATVRVTDSAGAAQQAPLLYVSSAQVNYIVPAGLAPGPATVAFNSGSATQSQQIQLGKVAPGMFTFNQAGLGAGSVLRVSGDGTQTAENLYQTVNGQIVALPINLGPQTDQVFLILYGTGFRAAGTANTTMTIGGQDAPVSFAGDQGTFAGLDQVNVLLPRSLAGRGPVDIVLKASGQVANTVNVSVR